MQKLYSIDIADIPIFDGTIPDAIQLCCEEIAKSNDPKNHCISLTGAHGLVYAQKNKDFKELLNRFYMNLPDGMPGVWTGKLKGAKKMQRCYGPDFFAEFMKASASSDIKHFLCGGKEGVADKLKAACFEKFQNDNIVGTFCPPFLSINGYNYLRIAKNINKTGADVVWVGISTPKQEQFAARLAEYTNVHFLITVGAAFDFHIGNVKQAPGWMQRNGLEWFYRVCTEPRRLWKRYLEIVPLFIYYSCLDFVKYKLKKDSER